MNTIINICKWIILGLPIYTLNAQNFQKIDSILTSNTTASMPGFGFEIHGPQQHFGKFYGLANLDFKITNTDSTVFRIGSNSKQFTAACIYLLENKNMLKTSNFLSQYFPELPDYANSITIDHLIHHTSGLRDYLMMEYVAGRITEPINNEKVYRLMKRQTKLNFRSGEKFVYCNTGYWFLSQIIKKVSGQKLDVFAKENIFLPLKMHHTKFVTNPNESLKNKAQGYSLNKNNKFETYPYYGLIIGDGALHSTVSDFQLWLNEMQNHTLLGHAIWKNMLKKGILNNDSTISYAGGLMIGNYKGNPRIKHGGSNHGFLSDFILFPDKKLSFIKFMNHDEYSPTNIMYKVVDQYLGIESKPAKKINEKHDSIFKINQDLLKSYKGAYKMNDIYFMEVSVKNDTLRIYQKWNKQKYPIIAVNDSTFIIPKSQSIKFTFGLNTKGNSVLKVLQNGSTFTCVKVNDTIKPVKMGIYDGQYYSKDLDATYYLKSSNDSLICTVKNIILFNFVFSNGSTFVDKNVSIKFDPMINGKLERFVLDAGRISDIEFLIKN